MRKRTRQQLIMEALNEIKAGECGMSEKELNQNKREMLKKACIGNGIMLSLLTIAIVLAVFSWFTALKSDVSLRGVNYVSGDNNDIRFYTQAGVMNNDGTLTFSGVNLNNDASLVAEQTVFPGQKRYFKTVIENWETTRFTGSLILQNLKVNKHLVDISQRVQTIEQLDGSQLSEVYSTAVNFTVEAKYNNSLNSDLDTSIYPKHKDSIFYLVNPLNYYVNDVLSEDYYLFNTQYICTDITLPPRTNAEPYQYEIIWEFQVDGETVINSIVEAEDVMNKPLLAFGNMRFVVNVSS